MSMKIVGRNVGLALALLTVASLVTAQEPAAVKSTSTEPDSAAAAQAVKEAEAYPFNYCIVTGEKLGSMGDPVVKTYDGREVKFCCGACPKTFEKDKAKWMKKLDAAVIAAQKPTYPLNTCVVTGDSLGSVGKPVDYVFGNRLVRFSRNDCIATFNKNPGKYLVMIDAAGAPKAAGSTEE
jgi:YHS domain-containing protein